MMAQRLTSAARPGNLAALSARRVPMGRAARPLFTGNQRTMQNVSRYLVKAALLSATLTFVALPDMARAQSGSAGGSIGNDEKSLSGSREAPRAVEPSNPARARKPEAEEPRRASRNSGGGGNGGGNYDGVWILSSVGTPCGGASETVVITSGRIVGEYGAGQVGSNGSATGYGAAGGITWKSTGRFSARGASGSFVRSDGCTGRWTGSKQ
jgi:hypothetical protein